MELSKRLRELSDNSKAKILQRFFKTGIGQYGEGDLFLGVSVPQQRGLVKEYWKTTSINEIKQLLFSKFHEERMLALLILVKKYESSNEKNKNKFVKFYLENLTRINNWDLVDLTAPKILGNFLINRDKSILYSLVKSKLIWNRRISIVSTLAFIREGNFQDTLKLSKLLLDDPHDLINKSVGWMLREVGKRDQNLLESFLESNYKKISRVTLRYSIERFSLEKRRFFLNKQ